MHAILAQHKEMKLSDQTQSSSISQSSSSASLVEKFDKILSLDKSKTRSEFKQKVRKELSDGVNKENMIAEEDKILLYKLYLKIKKEFESLDKSKL